MGRVCFGASGSRGRNDISRRVSSSLFGRSDGRLKFCSCFSRSLLECSRFA